MIGSSRFAGFYRSPAACIKYLVNVPYSTVFPRFRALIRRLSVNCIAMNDSMDRRTLLRSTGALAAAGLLAGCSGNGGNGGGDGGSDETTTSTTASSDGSGEVSEEVTSYLSSVSNFDGTVSDMTGQDTVTVMVGAEGNGGNFAFAPAAVRVSTGTTATFEWTGEGATHNVISEDGPLDSGSAVEGTGVKYEHTFEEPGTFTYYCTPHKSLEMKGAIVVEQ